MLLMAAMTNVQIVCFYFVACFVSLFVPVQKRNLMGFFWLLVVGKTNHVSSGEGNGGQDGLRSMSLWFQPLLLVISLSHEHIAHVYLLTFLQVRLVRVTKRVHEAYFAQLYLSKVCTRSLKLRYGYLLSYLLSLY